MGSFLSYISFILGLVAIFFYGWYIRPDGQFLGYFEDFCTDLIRQLMAENVSKYGLPRFVTDSVMAPAKEFFPFMSWPMERDWLGALFWNWDKQFPFLWFYFCTSLLISYLGSGLILKKMGIGKPVAWWISATIVLFHIPRHFKIWHHYELLPQHWVYWGFLLDAWIWQRFTREKKWSWNLELWRMFIVLGTFGLAGYYWGSTLLEWMLVRGFLLISFYRQRSRRGSILIEGTMRKAILPLILSSIWTGFLILWVVPARQRSPKIRVS